MFHFCNGIICMGILAAVFVSGSSAAAEANYDPLAVSSAGLPTPVDIIVDDGAREHREIPLRIYLPVAKSPAPIVIFSHGLGGTNRG